MHKIWERGIFCGFWLFKKAALALTAVSQWVGHCPKNQGVASSMVPFPVTAHAWVASQVPSWGHARGNQLMFVSHTSVLFPFISPSPSFSLKRNKITLAGVAQWVEC